MNLNFKGSSSSSESSFVEFMGRGVPPMLTINYLWGACKKGRIFDVRTYERGELTFWIDRTLEVLLKDMPLPKRFRKEDIVYHVREKVKNNLLSEGFLKSFESVDPEDVKSIREYINRNKKKEEELFNSFINFFRNDEFPPVLWMEFSRFKEVFTDSVDFLLQRMKILYQISPKEKSSIRYRNIQAKRMAQLLQKFSDPFLNATLNFIKILFFLDLWNSRDLGEIFERKKISFENLELSTFEEVFFPFHDSINQLRAVLFDFSKRPAKADFSDPVGWALKQLITMAEV